MKKPIVLFVVSVGPAVMWGQESSWSGKFMGHFGSAFSDNSTINTLIAGDGFVALSDWTYDAGLSYWIPFDRWSVVVDLHGASQSQDGANGYVSKQQFLRGGGSLGYDVLK